MLSSIQNLEDVRDFFESLIAEGTAFHPDEDFEEYIINETGEPAYSESVAKHYNNLMAQCFDICEKEKADIYDISMEIFLVKTGMDKLIPLPSSNYSD